MNKPVCLWVVTRNGVLVGAVHGSCVQDVYDKFKKPAEIQAQRALAPVNRPERDITEMMTNG